ncbi:MAG: CHASE3 domain-containing protein [Acetobacteraceae bacterium]|nr:CHASE3 domain-containing protein [Acetobacteraceae bacterium]
MAVLRMAAPAKLGLPRSRGQAGKGARRFGSPSGGARQARRTLALVLLAACAAASAAGGLWALAGLEDAGRLVRHTGEVIGQADGLLTALVDAETGQRGFLLTGEERYLEPYRAALGRVGPALDRLRELVADNPAQLARLPALRAGAEARLAELAETIARRRAGDAEGALAIVRTDRGKRTMDGLRAGVAGFEAGERRLLGARVAAAGRRGALATGLVGLAGLLAAAAVVAGLGTARAERALSEQEAHARAILDLNPQVLWTARPDGSIEDFAERWLAWTGLTRAEALGEGLTRVRHPDDLPRVAAAWSHALATGQPYDVEHRVRMADGSYRWMRSRAVPRRDPASGAVLRWYGATEDVHDHHEAEAALREGEARFRAIFEQAAVGMGNVALDGAWLRVNRRLCGMLGYTEAELRARTFQDITHPDDLEADRDNVRRLLAGEIATYSMEKRYIRRKARRSGPSLRSRWCGTRPVRRRTSSPSSRTSPPGSGLRPPCATSLPPLRRASRSARASSPMSWPSWTPSPTASATTCARRCARWRASPESCSRTTPSRWGRRGGAMPNGSLPPPRGWRG